MLSIYSHSFKQVFFLKMFYFNGVFFGCWAGRGSRLVKTREFRAMDTENQYDTG